MFGDHLVNATRRRVGDVCVLCIDGGGCIHICSFVKASSRRWLKDHHDAKTRHRFHPLGHGLPSCSWVGRFAIGSRLGCGDIQYGSSGFPLTLSYCLSLPIKSLKMVDNIISSSEPCPSHLFNSLLSIYDHHENGTLNFPKNSLVNYCFLTRFPFN